MKNNNHSSNTRRSTIDSFETNLRQFQETNKLLTNIENKLSDYVQNSKEVSPYHRTGHLEDFEGDSDERRRGINAFQYDEHMRTEANDQEDYTSPDSGFNRTPVIRNSGKGMYKGNMRDFRPGTRTIYESQPEEYGSENEEGGQEYEDEEMNSSSVRLVKDKMGRAIMTPQHSSNMGQARLSNNNYYNTSERFRQLEEEVMAVPLGLQGRNSANRAQVSNSGMKTGEKNGGMERFYQNKIAVLEERVRVDEREIYDLRKMNEDLRLEVTRLRGELQEYKQTRTDDIWEHFREQKESLQRGFGEGIGKRNNGVKGEKKIPQFPQQFEYRKIEEVGHGLLSDGVASAVPSERQELGGEDEKLGFLFGLINRYKQEVDLLKDNNVLIQQQLQQEIRYLKKDLNSQRQQNVKLETALQQERRNSQAVTGRENSQFYTGNFKGEQLEQMSKDELARFTKSLQDSFMNLEEKHLQQVRHNETIQRELSELRLKTKEEERQFDEAYHKIFDGQDNGTRHDTRNSEPVKVRSVRKSYKENEKKNNSPPVKEKKGSAEKSRVLRETHDTNRNEYYMHPKLQGSAEKERKRRNLSLKAGKPVESQRRKTSRDKAGNKSFETFDGLISEIKKVKKTVEEKIAEKSGGNALNKTVIGSEVVTGRYGVPLKDGRKSKRGSISKAKTMEGK